MHLTAGVPVSAHILGMTSAPGPGRGLALATFVSWMITACIGAGMLFSWVRQGGHRHRRATGQGPPAVVIFGHFGLAVSGLAVWAGYVAAGWMPLAWTAALLLMPAVGLGISTVTLWTPYPGRPAATPPGGPAHGAAPAGSMLSERAEDTVSGRLTDETLARALTDDVLAGRLADMVLADMAAPATGPARKPRGHLRALIPVGHGVAAVTTILLIMLTVSSAG